MYVAQRQSLARVVLLPSWMDLVKTVALCFNLRIDKRGLCYRSATEWPLLYSVKVCSLSKILKIYFESIAPHAPFSFVCAVPWVVLWRRSLFLSIYGHFFQKKICTLCSTTERYVPLAVKKQNPFQFFFQEYEGSPLLSR